MSRTVRLLVAGSVLFQGGFVKAGDATELALVVKVYNRAGFDEATIASAEQIVTDVFQRFGVALAWERAVDDRGADSGLDAEGRRPDLWIHLVPVTAAVMGADIHTGGLATGIADGRSRTRIWVFRPILETIIDQAVFLTPQKNPKRLRSVLLANVMAHEMGHLLLGSAKHGHAGIMTSSFGLNAIRQACTEGLAFSHTESGKIRATVQGMKDPAYALASQP